MKIPMYIASTSDDPDSNVNYLPYSKYCSLFRTISLVNQNCKTDMGGEGLREKTLNKNAGVREDLHELITDILSIHDNNNPVPYERIAASNAPKNIMEGPRRN
jgi:hypothetical protein